MGILTYLGVNSVLAFITAAAVSFLAIQILSYLRR